MKYRVILQPRALQNLEEQYQHIATPSSAIQSNRWLIEGTAAAVP